MSPIRAADVVDLDKEVPEEERTSGIRMKSRPEIDLPRSEMPTLPPPDEELRSHPSDWLDEVLFRLDCGDFDGALSAADPLLSRVPVLLMEREEIGTEPFDYWELNIVSHVDGEASIIDLIDQADLPFSDAMRVFCRLAERRIIALR